MSTVMVYKEARQDVSRTTATEATDQAPRTRSRSLNLLVSNFDRFYILLHRYLLHRLFDAELAEELTAQTFYKAAAAAGRLPQDATHMQAWLLRAATNLANTHYRGKRLRQLLLGRWTVCRPLRAGTLRHDCLRRRPHPNTRQRGNHRNPGPTGQMIRRSANSQSRNDEDGQPQPSVTQRYSSVTIV